MRKLKDASARWERLLDQKRMKQLEVVARTATVLLKLVQKEILDLKARERRRG